MHKLAQSVWAAEYTDCISAEEYNSLNECPDMTLNKLMVRLRYMQELWGMPSANSLSPLPGPL